MAIIPVKINRIWQETPTVKVLYGPPPMIHSTADTLGKMGIQNSHIRYELWW